jgi:hypothetical protein
LFPQGDPSPNVPGITFEAGEVYTMEVWLTDAHVSEVGAGTKLHERPIGIGSELIIGHA